MGILVSPLIAPLLGGILDTLWSWRACYAFLLLLCAGVTFSMAKWMPETRPEGRRANFWPATKRCSAPAPLTAIC